MIAVLLGLARPFLGYIVGGVIISLLAGGLWLKIRNDAQRALLVRIEQEKTDAIDQAAQARERLRALCERAPTSCLSDDWFRD